MIMQPSENDFMNPEFRPYLDKYMRGKDVDAISKARLLRLAHDLAFPPLVCARSYTILARRRPEPESYRPAPQL